MGFSRTDGKYKIYIIKHLYKDKPGDWGDSGDCCHWIPKEIIRKSHDELIYNGIFKPFTANGKCWQSTGIHGSYVKRDAVRILDKISEWNPHYKKPGVMAYWHVDNNSTCIFSQLKTISSSEIAAMLRGLIHHETEMRIESNYVDSHGQSEVAFTFCRLRNIFLHPRLRGIKEQLLYLPDRNLSYSNLKGVIARHIRWNNVNGQYSEMVRYITAAIEKTGPIDSILRRFHRNNNQNPTYKAFTEIGKALKTIHICRYLTDENYRREINDALNIVENWNSYNSFISYGNDFELPTNDPEMQELAILCIQLLQNAVILTNSILIEKIIWSEGLYNKMAPEDIAALTALIGININPYGHLNLDFNKPSFLNVA